MSRKRLDSRSLLWGLGIGAGSILLGKAVWNRDPHNPPDQRRVNRALDRALKHANQLGKIRLERQYRYVIFSDHHKGARNLADDFRQCESTYLAALDYYHPRGYTLIILGDAEELLEEKVNDVVAAYGNVFTSEARFHPDRLIRVHGNHDAPWHFEQLVHQYLDSFFPEIKYRNGLVFEHEDGEDTSGEIFLLHGHQGTLDSDVFPFLGETFLPYYRDIQILTGIGRTRPSEDACLRSRHDNRMYHWSSRKSKLILIAGHTHRPVWSSKTHLEKLTGELYDLLQLEPEQRSADYEAQVMELKGEIHRRQLEDPPCEDIIKTKPSYFNTGCCRFEDGDITGIELENGTIRLIKWGLEEGEMNRKILEQNNLSNIFFYL